MWKDPIIEELDNVRAEILEEFGGDFEAYLDYLETLEAENRKRGLRYADPPADEPLSSRSDAA